MKYERGPNNQVASPNSIIRLFSVSIEQIVFVLFQCTCDSMTTSQSESILLCTLDSKIARQLPNNIKLKAITAIYLRLLTLSRIYNLNLLSILHFRTIGPSPFVTIIGLASFSTAVHQQPVHDSNEDIFVRICVLLKLKQCERSAIAVQTLDTLFI